jgi:hypothetical protein
VLPQYNQLLQAVISITQDASTGGPSAVTVGIDIPSYPLCACGTHCVRVSFCQDVLLRALQTPALTGEISARLFGSSPIEGYQLAREYKGKEALCNFLVQLTPTICHTGLCTANRVGAVAVLASALAPGQDIVKSLFIDGCLRCPRCNTRFSNAEVDDVKGHLEQSQFCS